MILEGPTAIRAVEAVEALRAFVLAECPSLADRIDRMTRLPWDDHPAGERAALAVAVHLGLDPEIPVHRRHARRIAQALQEEGDPPFPESSNGSLPIPRESTLPGLKRSLAWVCSDLFRSQLKAVSGPAAAVRLVSRKAPSLRGVRASRFLSLLGYPAIVLDTPRLVWLRRMGWIDAAETSPARARQEALRVLGAVSVQGGIPLWELERLSAAFTGAERAPGGLAARCVRRPDCPNCPIRSHCAYGIAQELRPGGLREAPPEGRRLRESMASEDLPREKLLRLGAEALGNSELLAILIRTGNGRQHAVELAGSILAGAESLDRLAHMSIAEMKRLPGLGTVKAVTIKAALELARRLGSVHEEQSEPVLRSARAVYEYLRPHFVQRRREHFLAILLDTKGRVIRRVVISEGLLNQSLVHPREAFQEALRDSAHAIIFVHNHPSGDPAPSRDDKIVTARLVRAGEILGIHVRDHIIMGDGQFFSFADEGLIQQGT